VLDILSVQSKRVDDFLIDDNGNDNRRGGEMILDSPVWVCAYANNQWQLNEDIAKHPKKSGFLKGCASGGGQNINGTRQRRNSFYTCLLYVYALLLTLIDSRQLILTVVECWVSAQHTNITHAESNKNLWASYLVVHRVMVVILMLLPKEKMTSRSISS